MLQLPALVAGRDLADAFVEKLDDVKGNIVQVDARELVSGTASFAAQLVRDLLVDEGADELILVGAPAKFAGYAREAAQRLGVSAQLSTQASLATVS